MRLLKAFKVLKYNRQIRKVFSRFNLSNGASRITRSLIFAFFMVHLFSCFWYMQARFEGLSP